MTSKTTTKRKAPAKPAAPKPKPLDLSGVRTALASGASADAALRLLCDTLEAHHG